MTWICLVLTGGGLPLIMIILGLRESSPLLKDYQPPEEEPPPNFGFPLPPSFGLLPPPPREGLLPPPPTEGLLPPPSEGLLLLLLPPSLGLLLLLLLLLLRAALAPPNIDFTDPAILSLFFNTRTVPPTTAAPMAAFFTSSPLPARGFFAEAMVFRSPPPPTAEPMEFRSPPPAAPAPSIPPMEFAIPMAFPRFKLSFSW